MSKIFVPSAVAADWKRLLAEPEKHWKTGYSAKTLAQSWESAKGLPPGVAALFELEDDADGLLLALPEYKVALPGPDSVLARTTYSHWSVAGIDCTQLR